MARLKYQRGFLALFAIILIVVAGSMCAAAAYFASASSISSNSTFFSEQAFYEAERSLDNVIANFYSPTTTFQGGDGGITKFTAGCTGNLPTTGSNVTLSYTTLPNLSYYSDALGGAMTTSTATIKFSSQNSLTNFPVPGRVLIDKEFINYAGKSNNNGILTNLTRGADGSTVAPHAVNTRITAYLCNITSKAIWPASAATNYNLNNQFSIRTLRKSVQLPMAWVAGNNVGGKTPFYFWNAPDYVMTGGTNTWSAVLNSDQASIDIFGISMLSYDFGVAVGTNGYWYTWQYGSWVNSGQISTNNYPVPDFTSVSCLNQQLCFAVSKKDSSGQSWFAKGTGNYSLTWANVGLNGTSNSYLTNAGVNVNSIACQYAVTVSGSVTTATSGYSCITVGDKLKAFTSLISPTGAAVKPALTTTTTGFDEGNPYRSVSCIPGSTAATTTCWAINSVGKLAYTTDSGQTWSNPTATAPAGNYYSIYCFTATGCYAAGSTSSGTNGNPVIVQYNGSSWTAVSYIGNHKGTIKSIACLNPNFCWGVGTATDNPTAVPLVVTLSRLTGYNMFYNISGLPQSTSLNTIGFIGAKSSYTAGFRELTA